MNKEFWIRAQLYDGDSHKSSNFEAKDISELKIIMIDWFGENNGKEEFELIEKDNFEIGIYDLGYMDDDGIDLLFVLTISEKEEKENK